MKLPNRKNEISLYHSGFKENDLLGRNRTGEYLSQLVDSIETPMVIAIDGAWGTGKSHFLKCWVGAHSRENNGEAVTVYVDAFQCDFFNDPLLSLVDAIANRFPEKSGEPDSRTKAILNRLWRPAVRIGLAVGTAGASEYLGSIGDSHIQSTSKELEGAIDQLAAREVARRQAILDFKKALEELTLTSESAPRKIAIVVDELDRCRPDFALEMLEISKHFFNVENVHFILGANMTELANSVRARYGSGSNAVEYLEKFVTIAITLPDRNTQRGNRELHILSYYDNLCEEISAPKRLRVEVREILEHSRPGVFSLRDIERITNQLVLLPNKGNILDRLSQPYAIAMAFLTVIKAKKPKLLELAKRRELSLNDALDSLNNNGSNYHTYVTNVWKRFLSIEIEDNDGLYRRSEGFSDINDDSLINLINEFFDVAWMVENKA